MKLRPLKAWLSLQVWLSLCARRQRHKPRRRPLYLLHSVRWNGRRRHLME
jgi:hypothetical protein